MKRHVLLLNEKNDNFLKFIIQEKTLKRGSFRYKRSEQNRGVNEKMTKMVLSEWGGRIEFWFFALLKRSTHFSEYVVSEGAGVRVDSLGGVSRACSGRIPV